MYTKSKLRVVRKNLFSENTYVLDSDGMVGTLKLPFFGNYSLYTGNEFYNFHPIDLIGNSFRVYKEGKSIGYIHIHVLRNMAHIILLDEGPYQFSLKGFINGNWVMRQGKVSIEKMGNDLHFHQVESTKKELLVACALFTAAKINKDLILFLPIFLLACTFLILI